MKTFTKSITVILILVSNCLLGQSEYQPVNFDNGRWVFTSFQKGPFWGIEYEIDTIRYYFNGDTTIGANIYHKLYLVGVSYNCATNPMIWRAVNGYVGAIRDDTMHRIVYANGDTAYDYNLAMNDTVKSGFFKGHIITGIDSVEYCAQYFPRFNLNNIYGWDDAMIENIRVLDVFYLFPYDGQTGWRELKCYYETNSNFCYSCALVLGQNEILKKPYFIYPNPSSGMINIQSSDLINSISVYNITGNTIFTTNEKNRRYKVEIPKYSTGIYFLRIEVNGKVYDEKIVLK